MRPMKRALIVLTVLVGTLSPWLLAQSNGQRDNTFRQFAAQCREVDDAQTQGRTISFHSVGYCDGYMTAVLTFSDSLPVCIPAGAKVGDLEKIIVKYANEHPERLFLPREMEILKAIREAYPCTPKH